MINEDTIEIFIQHCSNAGFCPVPNMCASIKSFCCRHWKKRPAHLWHIMQFALPADGLAGTFIVDNQDTFSWNLEGQMLCNKWQKLGVGEEHCYTVYRKLAKPEKYRLFDEDGSAHASAYLK